MNAGLDHPGTGATTVASTRIGPGGTPPALLGRYRVEGLLGRGGMGLVYLAHDEALERPVALKVLPDAVAHDARHLARFRREARLLAALQHPFIAAVHSLERTPDGTWFLVLERVEGTTLAERLRSGPLGLEATLRVGEQVADALRATHGRGILHRDLKPANVMITPDGDAKVLDFGLARRLAARRAAADPAEEPTFSGGEAPAGTPGYMSPEQALGQPLDERSDLFALGCVLFECLSGRPAFAGSNAAERTAATLSKPPAWELLPGEAPAALRALLCDCLARDPARRVADAGRVRDLLSAVRGAGGEEGAPAVARPRHNLPRSATSFVGRERELAELGSLLGCARLLTLTGVGGCGKTRLALRLAERSLERHSDGVWFVDLALVADGDRVPQVLAAAMGVRERPGEPLVATLVSHLRHRQALVVLDNCEHVLAACAELARALLDGTGSTRILATSREAMGLPGEVAWPIPSLSLPAAGAAGGLEALERSEAAHLLVERVALVRPGFRLSEADAPAVAEICRRLDGLPLALELAAARARVLSLEDIRGKLDDRFRLLTGGSRASLSRHMTLRAALQWSFEHLEARERDLLTGLAVFAGGWTLGAAAAVHPGGGDPYEVLDLLARLVEQSLVVVDRLEGSEARYRMLESVRQYALEALDRSGGGPAARDRHLDHFLALAIEAKPRLFVGAEQPRWLARLGAEQDNLLAAHAWCDVAEDGAAKGLRLAEALTQFWHLAGLFDTARRVLSEALGRPGAAAPSLDRANALRAAGTFAAFQDDVATARVMLTESLVVSRTLGDRANVARTLNALGIVVSRSGDLAEARPLALAGYETYRELDDVRGMSVALGNLGVLAFREGDLHAARGHLEESLALVRRAGDKDALAGTLLNLAVLETRLGSADAAAARLVESLETSRELGALRTLPDALEALAELALLRSRPEVAALAYGTAERLREDHGMPLAPEDRRQYDEVVLRIRSALGAAELERRRAEGRSRTPETALRDALDWLAGGRDPDRGAAPAAPGATFHWGAGTRHL